MINKAIVWIREDFRINDNPALAHASQHHSLVSALYIFNPKVFIKKREAQQWWLSKSLENFKTELSKLNINLEIQIGEEIDVLSKINPRDDLTIYWNKVYEPDVIKLGKKIRDNIF
jgi:deoxyribodipyrimidine photo-lyase